MNKLFEQFTNDIKGKFSEAFAKEDFANFMQKTKAAADSGNFRRDGQVRAAMLPCLPSLRAVLFQESLLCRL